MACLIRITLVRSEPDCATLLITAHHTVFDGYSIRVLGKEIGTAAAAFEQRQSVRLPDLQLQYADYSLWQQELQASPALEENAAYWESQLQGAPYFEIEPDVATKARPVRSGRRVSTAFPGDFGEKLAASSRAHNTSLFVLGATAAAETLRKFSGQSDVCFGTAVAGRDETKLEDLIGVFINPIVLRFGKARDGSFVETITQTGKVVQDALAHGDYPFADLVGSLKGPRDVSRTPLVSVFFGLQRVFLEEQTYGPFSIGSVLSKAPHITHDLNIQVIGRASGWRLIIDYDAARFDERTVTELSQLFHDVFLTLLHDPNKRASDVRFAGRTVMDVVHSPSIRQ